MRLDSFATPCRTGSFAWPLFLLAAIVCVAQVAGAQRVTLTPPMGWNSWNTFKKNINEKVVREEADAMVSSGMRDAGYSYVTIDDGWQLTTRDSSGHLQYDAKEFPSGIESLARYVHERGLKFGIYTSAGVKTCMRREGSYGYELDDLKLFASWGVDFVKVDWCCTNPEYLADPTRACPANPDVDYGKTGQQALYERWRTGLDQVPRPIVLSICEWGLSKPWTWAPAVGDMWRTTDDILPCRTCRKSWWGLGWELILEEQAELASYAGPGHWNDPDMLVVGAKGVGDRDAKVHFSFWALLAAPLIAGNDPRHMSATTRGILENRAVIAIDQDPLGREGRLIARDGAREVWMRPLAGEARAVILFNRGDAPARMRIDAAQAGLAKGMSYEVRDMWSTKPEEDFHGELQARVGAHDIVMLKLTPKKEEGSAQPSARN